MLTYSVATKLLENVDGASFAGMDSITDVKLTGGKSNPQLGRITKVHTGANIMLFTNKATNAYRAMVQRRLVKESKNPEDFKLQPRVWGTRVPNSPFVEHKGAHYMEVIFIKAGESTYELDGKPIDKADIIGLPKSRDEGRDKPSGQGGLEDKVVIRTYKLSSIKAIRIDGTEYTF